MAITFERDGVTYHVKLRFQNPNDWPALIDATTEDLRAAGYVPESEVLDVRKFVATLWSYPAALELLPKALVADLARLW